MLHIFAFMVLIGVPFIATAAAPRTLQELANMITTYFNAAAGVLIAAVIVWYFWGATSRMFSPKKNEKKELLAGESSQFLLRGIIAIFVLVSVWGIVRLLQTTLFGTSGSGSSSNSTTQTSQFTAPVFNQ